MSKAMKTIYNYIILIAAVVLAAGCIKENFMHVEPAVELSAWIENDAETRTILSDFDGQMYYPLWSAGDEIAVYADGDLEPSKFSLNSGEGTTSATFTGTRGGNELVAIYPYDMAGSMSDGTVSLVLPQSQNYLEKSFAAGSYPMFATGTVEDGLNFRNLCSVLKITFTGNAAIRSVTLTSRDKKCYLSGAASVKVDQTEPSANPLTMATTASNSVILNCNGLKVSERKPVDVYIVIPAQTYKRGFTIEVDTYTEKVSKTITSSLKFERSQLRAIKEFQLNSEIPAIIPEAIPNNEIWYVSSDGSMLDLLSTTYNANIVSHTYSDGKGVICFDADLTTINGEVFGYDCTHRLEKVIMPATLTYVTHSPFYSSYNLTEIMGPLASADGKCLVIDGQLAAFAQKDIEEYTTPQGVTSIAPMAFQYNRYLKKIVLSEGVRSVGWMAFMNIETLQEITLPSSLNYMEYYAFTCCPNVKRYQGECNFVTSDNLALVVDNYNNYGIKAFVAFASASTASEYSIPEGVQLIENYAFFNANNLQKVNIPDSFEAEISPYIFAGSANIKSVTGKYASPDERSLVQDGILKYVAPAGLKIYETPVGVSRIADMALANIGELVEVTLGPEVIKCETGMMFYNNPNLETITLSPNMTDLGYDPFVSYMDRTPSLKSVYCKAVIPPAITYGGGAEDAYDFSDLTIYVPKESYNLYIASPYWDRYVKYIKSYDYGDLSDYYPDYYISTDYSSDGTVKNLQRATKGKGINIVLMGDAYSDRQISDGTYAADMKFLYQNLFTEEPFKTYKKMFNVYYVNVVSMTEGYDYPGSTLGGYFGEGTLVGGNDQKCFEYALKAISDEKMDEALIIVAMNSNAYAGTCWMYYPESSTDYGSGPSVAYFPKGEDPDVFAQLLHHEANGHGFAKLADEYAYEDYGAVPTDIMNETKSLQESMGWYKNVDFTNNKRQVRWSHFLEDSRYANEGLGCYEGGFTYWTGVWRPTENSIMNQNVGGFNAPCREAIYYRINKLANGASWKYDYEDFVKYDVVNRASAVAAGSHRRNYVEKAFEPTTPPVVVKKSWRDAE